MKIDVAKEIEKAQNALDDCNEAISVLDNAIQCGFLDDDHNFAIIERWLPRYRKKIKEMREHIENMRTNGYRK